ncbi:MAG: acyl-CoA thioesterase [Elusimicrobia bacterium]|nr:acyl-CoA thioesterase [Elusimicrobiota bacterium]
MDKKQGSGIRDEIKQSPRSKVLGPKSQEIKETSAPTLDVGLRTLDSFKVIVPIQARFRDTDMMGHVNNAVYLSYLELSRVHYWKAIGGALSDFSKVSFILARVEIDYKSPVKLGEPVEVAVRCSEVRGASFDFDCKIFAGEPRRLAAQAKTVQAMYDYVEKKPVRMPEELRRKISEFEGWPKPAKPEPKSPKS